MYRKYGKKFGVIKKDSETISLHYSRSTRKQSALKTEELPRSNECSDTFDRHNQICFYGTQAS